MKTSLLYCFLSIAISAFGQRDVEIIKQIDSLNTTASIYFNNGDIVESFNDFSKSQALPLSVEGNYGLAFSSLNLGNIYLSMEQETAAENSYKSALEAAEEAKDYTLIAASKLRLANIYKNQKAYSSAISYFESALKGSAEYLKNEQDKSKKQLNQVFFYTQIGLSEAYILNNQLDEALINLLKSEEILQQNDLGSYSRVYFNYM